MIVVALVKGIGKLAQNKSSGDSPAARPRRRRVRPASQPPHIGRRAETARPQPLQQHQHRDVAHQRKQGGYQRPESSPAPARRGGGWKVSMDDLQEFLTDLSETPSSHGPPPVPPPLTQSAAEKTQRASRTPPPAATTAAAPDSAYARHDGAPPPTTAQHAVAYKRRSSKDQDYARPSTRRATPTRASRWTEALQDRSNLRNIIIANEIIGPPKAMRQD